LPPEHFRLRGFAVVHAVDVTQSEVLASISRNFIDKETIVSKSGFTRLQQKLRSLFQLPRLEADLAAVQGTETLLVSAGSCVPYNCIFSGSLHVPTSEFRGSVFDRAWRHKDIVRIPDLAELPSPTRVERDMLSHGFRSVLAGPLHYQGDPIGILELKSPNPGDLGPAEELLMRRVLPLFAMALKRALDELNNNVDRIIKQECTAIHPSVEWRFRKAVLDHIDRVRRGEKSELEPIVFRDVYPLYGATDIRGSSEARNRAIRDDLIEHLSLSLNVINAARKARPLHILGEFAHRVERELERITGGISGGDEQAVVAVLRLEVEPIFSILRNQDGEVAQALDAYYAAVDSKPGTVYRRRKEFEESVSYFNDRITAYLDGEEAEAQAVFPHYFDKHRTDGVGYLIYIGPSMVENGGFSDLYVRNLRLWQLITACGIAWETEQLKSRLSLPLTSTHLILVHTAPLSIRFRFDEKRFDVDGTYDVAHEIVRSRIDKAFVKGGTERLTQPGKIAVVYSRPEEYRELRGHLDFLRSKEYLTGETESLDLEDLPGVQGLKALRVEVNLGSERIAERVRRMMLPTARDLNGG
ncbi:MAG: GAF domain-containing protein, partial [Pseudomonadota bacterium]